MFRNLYNFLDKKTKIQLVFIQIIFLISTFLEFINLNFILLFLISIFTEGVTVKNSGILNYIFLYTNHFNVIVIGVLSLVIFFISSSLILLSNWLIFYYANLLREKIIIRHFYENINKNITKLNENCSSDIIHEIGNEIPKITDGIIMPLLKIINKTFLLIVMLFFLFSNYFEITLKILIFSLSLVFVFYLVLKNLFYKFGVKVSKSHKALYEDIKETFDNFRTVKIFSLDNFFLKQIKLNAHILTKFQSLGYFFGLIPKFFFELFALSIVIFIFINFKSDKSLLLTDLLPTIGIFTFIGYRLVPIFQEFFISASTIKNNQYAFSTIINSETLKNNNILKKQKIGKDFNIDIKKIILKKINFKYKKNGSKVFSNFSCIFEAGKITTITGKSGSGKTTLINIILGFLKPNKGKFLINNKVLSFFSYKKIISKIASLNEQLPNLFNTTLSNNIDLNFSQKIKNKNKIFRSLKSASLDNLDITKRINKNVGDKGKLFSGGQVQRILIARAIYHDKRLLIFDEPTNFLDLKNKLHVLRTLKKIKKNKIIIIISHDNSVISISDRVVKL